VTQPIAVQQMERQLVNVWADAWQQIVAEQERLLENPAAFRRRARLVELRQEVERQLDRMDAAARAWLETTYPEIYAAGAHAGAGSAGETISSWTLTHTEALQQLVNDTYADLLKATKYVRRDVKRFIQSAAKEVAGRVITTGQTAVGGGRTLAQFLDAEGIKGIRYKDGSLHGLSEYGEMVIRTKTATAYNEGTLNGATDAGVTYFEVFDGPNCGWTFHEDPNLAMGMIVNAKEARAEPISHPNCRRTFGGRPDITSRKGAKVAPRSATTDQIAAQRQADLRRSARRPRTSRKAVA
jgi:hypothetical protein